MTLIYSDEEVEGLVGAYVHPRYFDKNNLERARKVYAKDSDIIEAYSNQGIEAISLEKPKQTRKKKEED